MSFRKLPPLHALTAFEAVARHQSFTKAATELFLTHSAVSQRISALESHLDVQLLIRSKRSITLTSEGERYLEVVRGALSQLDTASQALSPAARVHVRVSTVPALASNWLAPLVPKFCVEHPHIDLEIHSSVSFVNVRSGEADIALRWGRGQWAGLEATLLFQDELFPVCSPAYRRSIGVLAIPEDLQKGVLLRHSLQPWKPWFSKVGLDWPEPQDGPSFNDSALMLTAAEQGAGIALARKIIATPLLRKGQLVRLFDVPVTGDEAIYLVCNMQRAVKPEVRAVVDWLIAQSQSAAV